MGDVKVEDVELKLEAKVDGSSDDNVMFSVAVIADVQYANAKNGRSSVGNIRRYRQSLNILKNGIKIWNDDEITKPKPVCLISLGDLLDRWNVLNDDTDNAIKSVINVLNEFIPKDVDRKSVKNVVQYPYFHNLNGNHELYNFNRIELNKLFYGFNNIGVKDDELKFYYEYKPHKCYSFIFLDSYEISILGYNDKHTNYIKAKNLLSKMSLLPTIKHILKDGAYIKYGNVQFSDKWINGAYGDKQLKWLENILIKYENNNNSNANGTNDNINVILFSHVPCYSKVDPWVLSWDHDKLINILNKYKCVKMFFAGHEHGGCLIKDKHNLWHKTFEGAVEAKKSDDPQCFGTLYFYKNKCVLKGYGIKSETFNYR